MNKPDTDLMERAQRNVAKLEQEGLKVQILGRIVNGKIELDQQHLKELAERYPNTNMAFIALNSPFDPVSCAAD